MSNSTMSAIHAIPCFAASVAAVAIVVAAPITFILETS